MHFLHVILLLFTLYFCSERDYSLFDLRGAGFSEVFVPLLFPQIYEPGKLFCLLLKRLLCPYAYNPSKKFISDLKNSLFSPSKQGFFHFSHLSNLSSDSIMSAFIFNKKEKKVIVERALTWINAIVVKMILDFMLPSQKFCSGINF